MHYLFLRVPTARVSPDNPTNFETREKRAFSSHHRDVIFNRYLNGKTRGESLIRSGDGAFPMILQNSTMGRVRFCRRDDR